MEQREREAIILQEEMFSQGIFFFCILFFSFYSGDENLLARHATIVFSFFVSRYSLSQFLFLFRENKGGGNWGGEDRGGQGGGTRAFREMPPLRQPACNQTRAG